MSFKKNYVIITALVVMIAAAGYLNYIDTGSQVSDVMLTDEGDVAAVPEVAVNDEDTEILAEAETETGGDTALNDEGEEAVLNEEAADPDAGKAVFVNSSSDSSYFVQAKLEREQSRNKQKDMLNEMLNNENIENKKKNEVTTAMLQIQQRIEKENKVTITQTENGCYVNCSISGGDMNLMNFQLYVPDINQARLVRKNFHKSPETVYKVMVALMTRNKDLIDEALSNIGSLL